MLLACRRTLRFPPAHVRFTSRTLREGYVVGRETRFAPLLRKLHRADEADIDHASSDLSSSA